MENKDKIVHILKNRILEKKKDLNILLQELQQSLLNETKSTAGDKHETGRAMVHLEIEKKGQQLQFLNTEIQKLKQINFELKSAIVIPGSIVKTDKANYLIAISLGEIMCEKEKYYAISPVTPIGKMLMNKKEGDSISFNGMSSIIKKIN